MQGLSARAAVLHSTSHLCQAQRGAEFIIKSLQGSEILGKKGGSPLQPEWISWEVLLTGRRQEVPLPALTPLLSRGKLGSPGWELPAKGKDWERTSLWAFTFPLHWEVRGAFHFPWAVKTRDQNNRSYFSFKLSIVLTLEGARGSAALLQGGEDLGAHWAVELGLILPGARTFC